MKKEKTSLPIIEYIICYLHYNVQDDKMYNFGQALREQDNFSRDGRAARTCNS